MDPVFAGPEGDGGEGGDDQEQHPGEGGGVAHAEIGEGLVVEIDGEEEQAIERGAGAAGNDEGAREALEGLDHLQDQVEEDDRGEQGHGDGEEFAHRAGGVDLGGFVELLRNGAQAGEEDQHGRAELPDGEKDQRGR